MSSYTESSDRPAILLGGGPIAVSVARSLGRAGIRVYALGSAPPDTVAHSRYCDVFVNLGALQAGQITQAQLQTNVLGAAAAEIQQVGRLMGAGARYVVVFALPDIGVTPAFAGSPFASAVTQLSAGYNTTLFSGLAQNGLRVIPVDVFSLFAEIRANAAAYGFTNTTGMACLPFPPFSPVSRGLPSRRPRPPPRPVTNPTRPPPSGERRSWRLPGAFLTNDDGGCADPFRGSPQPPFRALCA